MFSDFLEELKEKQINISFSNGKLQYSGPENNVTPGLISKLKEYKPKLIKHFWPAECHNLMPINTEGSKTPFFLVHGDQTNYYLSDHFGKDQPFYGFFHYGSDGGPITHNTVDEFVEDYINQMRVVHPDGPFLLAGFSFGGIIAYQMATELQKRGYEVPMLVLIDCKNPALPEPVEKESSSMAALPGKMMKFVDKYRLKVFYKSLKMYFKSYHIVNKPLPDKHRNRYIATRYIDIMRRYKPDRTYEGDILLFRASENPSVYHYMGWENLCDNIEMITIKGNHDSIKKIEESIDSLKKNIGKKLQAVQETISLATSQR